MRFAKGWMMKQPMIAITMGDPAGIGPELVVRVLSQPSKLVGCHPLVIGDLAVMQQAVQLLKAPVQFRQVSSPREAGAAWPVIDLLCPDGLQVGTIPIGKVAAEMGLAVGSCLRTAAELAMDGQVQGLVSTPLNKEAFHLAGFPYRDELAYLAEITDSPSTSIVGVMQNLWTITITEHIPFKDVAAQIQKERIVQVIQFFHQLLVERGDSRPRIVVAALNPHAGDGGLMGREEIDEIRPAVEAAKALGLDVTGPVPADIVFNLALQGLYDGVVCMYHDQANIARKLQPKEESATLFMGLPFACGTTAHGTAFDKAWQGVSDAGSLELATRCVIQLAQGKISEAKAEVEDDR
jgi:4-phospho-D-threonate 3-dehydrogenase / 4-phospho-D-erythronate 3-dehydrogenase